MMKFGLNRVGSLGYLMATILRQVLSNLSDTTDGQTAAAIAITRYSIVAVARKKLQSWHTRFWSRTNGALSRSRLGPHVKVSV